MIQGTKYSCGRQILWNVFAFANFYTELHNYFVKMNWMGLANMSEKFFCPLLVNEFYSGLLMHADEYETLCTLDLKICISSLMVKNELLRNQT